MSKYRFHNKAPGYESEYESDGGTQYRPEASLGHGSYAQARKFVSRDKEIAILAPTPNFEGRYDKQELQSKYNFFKTLYPLQNVKLIKHKDTYRLVTPLIPGVSYNKLLITDQKQQIEVFLSAVKALKDCHEKGMVLVDLKADNIHYEVATRKSYLIDGGFAAKKGQPIPVIFRRPTNIDIIAYRTRFPHFAPECWSTRTMRAQVTMDIYSLGYLMKYMLRGSTFSSLQGLIDACQDREPRKRPNLDQLEHSLEALLKETNQLSLTDYSAKTAATAATLESNCNLNYDWLETNLFCNDYQSHDFLEINNTQKLNNFLDSLIVDCPIPSANSNNIQKVNLNLPPFSPPEIQSAKRKSSFTTTKENSANFFSKIPPSFKSSLSPQAKKCRV